MPAVDSEREPLADRAELVLPEALRLLLPRGAVAFASAAVFELPATDFEPTEPMALVVLDEVPSSVASANAGACPAPLFAGTAR